MYEAVFVKRVAFFCVTSGGQSYVHSTVNL